MQWFRFYADALENEKVQSLSPETFKKWINILCLACKNSGTIPNEKQIAFSLRLTDDETFLLVEQFIRLRLIDRKHGKLRPHDWDERQFKSDTSTPRVRAFRERSGNVSETPPETPPDTDTDTEADTKAEAEQTSSISSEGCIDQFALIETKNGNGKRSKHEFSADFEAWWGRYPRKIGKGAAYKTWKHMDSATRMAASEALLGQGAILATMGSFCPHPATWLNQGRWDDEIGAISPQGSPKPALDVNLMMEMIERKRSYRQ